MSLARNDKKYLSHGWFLVKNRSDVESEQGLSLDQARANEASFFARSPWRDISPDRQGVHALRIYLKELFARHVANEFPALQMEMRSKLAQAREERDALGPPRHTTRQQRDYLLDLAMNYAKLLCHTLSEGCQTLNPTQTEDQ